MCRFEYGTFNTKEKVKKGNENAKVDVWDKG